MSKTFIKTASALAILASVGIPAVTVGVDVANAAEPNAISDFTFIIANGEVTITAYKGITKDVIIPSEIEGKPVTTIGDFAFDSKGLISVMIPDGVNSIGERAFSNNKITSIKIPDGVTNISQHAFFNNQLTSVMIPNNVTNIGTNAFRQNQLTSVLIPNKVTSIGEGAFSYNRLTSVTIPDSVTSIGNVAFAYNQLTSVNIPKSLTVINAGVFRDNKLTSIAIPDKVTKIEQDAFSFNNLTSVTIPNNVTFVSMNSFLANYLLTEFIVKNKDLIYSTNVLGGNSNVVVKAVKGSTSETYAANNRHAFMPMDFNDDSEETETGDDNGSITEGKTHHTDKATVKLQSGILNLDIASVLDFGTVRLEAQPKTVTTGFGDFFGVIDTRGTQEGWRVDVTATPFKIVEPAGGFKSGTSAHELPVGSLSISPLVGIERVGQNSGTMPKGTLSGKTILDDGAITVASAGIGEGMGQFKLEFGNDALSLIVDAATAKIDNVNYPGGVTPYESTITWDLVTGP